MAVAPLALLVALATAGDATAEAPKPRPQMRCHWNIDEDYCLSCAPGEEPPPGVCKNRSSTWSDPGCRGGFIHSDGKCEPYNNPDTNCTAPMALSDEFLSRVPKDVAVIYEGKLGLVPNQGACGWNSTTGRLVQPCPGGLTRMMLDYSTNSSFHGWPQNFEAWMARHLARLESDIETQASISWNKTAIPKDWDGIAYADLESIKPLWELEYLGRSQGPDCKPLDGDGPCTAMWGNPNATMCSGCSGPALWDWATFVKSVCAGALDPVLLASANFSAPAGATTWAGLTATQQLQLLKGSYDHYSRRFFSDTLAQLKALRPKARWGVWAYPKPALPNTSSFVEYRGFNASCAQFGPHKADANPDFPCTDLADWQRLNDELSWLWAQLDVLMPSLCARLPPSLLLGLLQYSVLACVQMRWAGHLTSQMHRAAHARCVAPARPAVTCWAQNYGLLRPTMSSFAAIWPRPCGESG
eukprot:COSAG01_NODE_4263_length_5198_cov_77.376937_8_plen_470_part_00